VSRTPRPPTPDHDELEDRLRSLHPSFPPTPDIERAVIDEIRRPRTRRLIPVRRGLILGLAAALLVGAVAVAGAFGVGPMRIIFSSALPSPNVPATSLGIRLGLGEPLSLDELRRTASIPLRVPSALGRPDESYWLDNGLETGIVSWIYRADQALPEIGDTDIGLLMMQIPGDVDPSLIGKIVDESHVTVERVAVGDAQGYWISGAPHVLRYRQQDGLYTQTQSRLVPQALVWESGDGVIFRIEASLSKEATISLAEALEPLPAD
jgi:hypothetical protein